LKRGITTPVGLLSVLEGVQRHPGRGIADGVDVNLESGRVQCRTHAVKIVGVPEQLPAIVGAMGIGLQQVGGSTLHDPIHKDLGRPGREMRAGMFSALLYQRLDDVERAVGLDQQRAAEAYCELVFGCQRGVGLEGPVGDSL
jgi:hypothetical protein